MASYEVTSADGQIYDIEGPEGVPDQEIIAAVQRQIQRDQNDRLFSVFDPPSPEEQEEQDAIAAAQAAEVEERAFVKDKKDTNAYSVGFSRAVDDAGLSIGSMQEGLGSLFDSDYLRQAGAERIAANEAQLAEAPEAMSYEDVEDLDSFGEYAGEVLGGTTPLTATSILGGALASAAVGAFTPLGPLGAVGGFTVGAIGGALSQIPFFYGSHRERQKEAIERGTRVEISEGAAFLSAIGAASLDSIAERLQITKMFPTQKLLRNGGFFTRAVKGAGAGVVTEVPTEMGQALIERAQAGLDIASQEATDEYWEVAVAAGLVGGTIGGTAAAVSPDNSGVDETRRVLEARIDELVTDGMAPDIATDQAVKETSEREQKPQAELVELLFGSSGQEEAELEALVEAQEVAAELAAEVDAEVDAAVEDEIEPEVEVEAAVDEDAIIAKKLTGEALTASEAEFVGLVTTQEKIAAIEAEIAAVEPEVEVEVEAEAEVTPAVTPEVVTPAVTPIKNNAIAAVKEAMRKKTQREEDIRKAAAAAKRAEDLTLPNITEYGSFEIDDTTGQRKKTGTTVEETQEIQTPTGTPIKTNEGVAERGAEVDARIAGEQAVERDTAKQAAKEESLSSPTSIDGTVKPYAIKTQAGRVLYLKNRDNAERLGDVIVLADMDQDAFNELVGRADLAPPTTLEQDGSTYSTYNKDRAVEAASPGDVEQVGPKTLAKVNKARNKALAGRDKILTNLNANIVKFRSKGQSSADAVGNAIKSLVANKTFKNVTSEKALLEQIGTSKERLIRADDPVFSRVDNANTTASAQAKKAQEAATNLVALDERINALEETGSEGSRKGAVTKAISESAKALGLSKKEFLSEVGTTEAKLVSNPAEARKLIGTFEEVLVNVKRENVARTKVGKKLASKIAKSSKPRAEAIPEAVKEVVKEEEGFTSPKQVYDLLGTTAETLVSDPSIGALTIAEQASFNARITEDVLSKVTELNKLARFLGVQFNPELDKILPNEVMVPLWNDNLEGALLAVAKMLPSTPEFAGMITSARKLATVVGDTRVAVVLKNPKTKLEKFYRQVMDDRADSQGPPVGMYYLSGETVDGRMVNELDNIILLEEGVQRGDVLHTGLTAATLLHEMSHAATLKFVRGNPDHKYVIEINELYKDFKEHAGGLGKTEKDIYALTDVEEFIAEAYGSAEFQQYLANLYVKESGSGNPVVSDNKLLSIWQWFKNIAYNILHVGSPKVIPTKTVNMKDAVQRTIDALLAPTYSDRGVGVLLGSQSPEEVSKLMRQMDVTGNSVKRYSAQQANSGATFGDKFAEFTSTLSRYQIKAAFKLTPSLAMADIAGWYDPTLGKLGKDVHDAMENQRSDLQKAEQQATATTAKLRAWTNPILQRVASPTKAARRLEEVKALNNVLGEGTVNEVDPSLTRDAAKQKYGFDTERFVVWEEMQANWSFIGPEGRAAYSDIITTYRKLYKKLIDTMGTSLNSLEGVEAETKKQLKGIHKKMLQQKLAQYVPLHRQGTYRLAFMAYNSSLNAGAASGLTGSTEDVFLMFETARARKRYVDTVLAGDKNVVKDTEGNPKIDKYDKGKPISYRGTPSTGFVNELLKAIPNNKAGKAMEAEIVSMFIDALPQTSFAKSFQKRQNVAGFDGQFTTEFGGNLYDLNRQITLMEHTAKLGKLRDQIVDIPAANLQRGIKVKMPTVGGRTNTSGSLNVIPFTSDMDAEGKGGEEARQSLLERIDFAVSTTSDPWAKGANRGAFLWTIGFNTSSALVNLSQLPIFIVTQLAGIHGYGETLSAVRSAIGHVLNSGFTRLDRGILDEGESSTVSQFAIPSIENNYVQDASGNFSLRKDKKFSVAKRRYLEDLIPLVKLAKSRGQLTSTAVSDYLGVNEVGRSRSIMDSVTTLSALMFHTVEQFNRQVSLIAAYKLEQGQIRKEHASLSRREQRAMAAEDALIRTQEFNGGAVLETAAPWFQKSIGRVAGMYKGFGLQMYYTMLKSGKTALTKLEPGATAKQKKVRKDAWAQIMGVYGASLFFSGVGGVPMFGMVAMMYDTIIKDDEDETLEEATRRELGTGWYKGGLSNMLGLDVAKRMAMTNLVLQENRFAYQQSPEEWAWAHATGPAGSVAVQFARGVEKVSDGDMERGIDMMLPAAVKNIKKYLKYGEDGGTIRNTLNRTVHDGVTTAQLSGQFLGFAPLDYALKQQDASRAKRIDSVLNDTSRQLLRDLNKAKLIGDDVLINEANAAIAEYNARISKTYPKQRIDNKTRRESYKNFVNITARAMATHGQTLSSRSSTDIIKGMFMDTPE